MLTNFPSNEHVVEPASEHPGFVDDAFLSTVIFDISNSLPCELLGFCNDRRSVVIDLQRETFSDETKPKRRSCLPYLSNGVFCEWHLTDAFHRLSQRAGRLMSAPLSRVRSE